MQDIIVQIATLLNMPNVDVYFLFWLLSIFWIFCFIGITKIYEIFFWLVLWISIFIVLQFLLLNPNIQVPSYININIAKYFVSSSVYLIFILSALVPLNSWLNIKESNNTWIRIFQIIILSTFLVLFYFNLIIWFTEKIYIYNIDSAFVLLKKISSLNEFISQSLIYSKIKLYSSEISLAWIFFVIYRLIFNDIVNMFISSIITSLKKIWNSRSWWSWWWHEDHDDWWHWHH